MNNPSVSVILPTYNVGKYISRCLDSCLAQNYDDFEIIIVDDCGSDNSIEMAEVYAAKDKRIKIIKNKNNMGTYHARRVGVESATGDYIIFLDPDDELACRALEKIALQICQNPGLDMLLFNSQYIPPLKLWNVKPKVPVGVFQKNIASSILKEKYIPYGTMGKLYSKNIIIQVYEFLSIPESTRLVYGEDVLIFAAALLHVNLAKGISDEMYIYHINETSITNQKSDINISKNIDQLEVVTEKLQLLKKHLNYTKVFEKFRKRTEIDKLLMMSNLVRRNSDHLKIMLEILSKDCTLRTATKLVIFTFFLKRKKD